MNPYDALRIPRYLMKLEKKKSYIGILLFFAVGAAILWFVAHPFLNSMLALAATLGISQFVFVQWVAPFLSEFPEKLSAFHAFMAIVREHLFKEKTSF